MENQVTSVSRTHKKYLPFNMEPTTRPARIRAPKHFPWRNPGYLILAAHLAVLVPITWSAPRLSYQVHWLANSSGRPEDHVQNFLEHMSVVYVNSAQYPRPLVLTKSFWDEGHVPNAAYHQGRRVEKNWWLDSTDSRTAKRGSVRCTIANFYGRGFLFKLAPPPSSGDSAPHVACSDSSSIRSVVDPTAIAFDMSGNLLVADNGPDQDVKIFSRSPGGWTLTRTFGTKGGVFSGPVPGAAGPRRFWGIRGLGVDSVGNVYVGNTGIPMQTMGGTDIRVFSGKDSSLLWQVQGLSFVNSADADPASAVTSVHLNAKRFAMDWTKPSGRSWSLAAVTLDPFRFPDDSRLQMPQEVAWVRRIEGSLFLYTSNMHSSFVGVYRFLPGEEIAAPCAFILARWEGRNVDGKSPWMDTIRPVVDDTRDLSDRWMWRDDNGDGRVQKSEFRWIRLAYPYVKGIDISDDGDIRFGGRQITHIPAGGLENGIPRFPSVLKESVPFTEGNGDALRLRYLKKQDIMYLAGGERWYPSFVHRYTNWSKDSSQRSHVRIALPYRDRGPDVIPRLDVNTADMLLPAGVTADSDYVYAVYGDRGPDGECIDLEGMFTGTRGAPMRCRAEISVSDAHTGQRLGWMAVDSSLGWYSGAIDIPHPINVATRPNGERIVFVEEDGKGKILAYRWCPSGDSSNCRGYRAPPPSDGGPRWRRSAEGGLQVRWESESIARARLIDTRGRMLEIWRPRADLSSGWSNLPLAPGRRGLYFLELTGASSTSAFPVFLAP